MTTTRTPRKTAKQKAKEAQRRRFNPWHGPITHGHVDIEKVAPRRTRLVPR